jgi:membrane-associated phospholipid phosphatase
VPIRAAVYSRDRLEAVDGGPFIAWPGWPHLLYAGVLSLANGAWFALVFYGCDLLTTRRASRIRVHLDAELSIPFVPAMTAVYMSIYLLFLAAPFMLRTRREFRSAVITLATMIGIAGASFLLVPARLAFPPATAEDAGIWADVYLLADRLNLTYNLVPSLHVALTVACVAIFSRRASASGRAVLWVWAIAVAASTLLTHQHHVLDVVAGWLLAIASVRLVHDRTFFANRCR